MRAGECLFSGGLCCKSLFAPVIENSPGFRRDLRVRMWGTSSPDDERTGDFGNEIEVISIANCGLFRLLAENLSPGILGLLQHNLPLADKVRCSIL